MFGYCFSKIVPFMRKCGKMLQNGAGHRRQYGSCTLHVGYLKLQIHVLRLCNTHCFSTTTIGERKRHDVIIYVHCLSCYLVIHILWSSGGLPRAANCILRLSPSLSGLFFTKFTSDFVFYLFLLYLLQKILQGFFFYSEFFFEIHFVFTRLAVLSAMLQIRRTQLRKSLTFVHGCSTCVAVCCSAYIYCLFSSV